MVHGRLIDIDGLVSNEDFCDDFRARVMARNLAEIGNFEVIPGVATCDVHARP
jgi:hypothetical protein